MDTQENIAFVATVDDVIVHCERFRTRERATSEIAIKRSIAVSEGPEHGWHIDGDGSVVHYRPLTTARWYTRPWQPSDEEVFSPI